MGNQFNSYLSKFEAFYIVFYKKSWLRNLKTLANDIVYEQ